MSALSLADAALARFRAWEGLQGEQLPDLPMADAVRRADSLLRPEATAGPAFPVEALGPLAGAAQALADGAQVAPAMAGQSLLAAAALLVQSTANVRSLDGETKPLSLACMSVALSGDGKDMADRVALRRVHEHQRATAREFAQAKAEHERAKAERKGDADPLPRAPFRIAADVTIEGLRRSFAEGIASQGAFSTEAGAVLAGYAMAPEQRMKTAATLCGMLDRGHLSVVRGGADRIELYGLRLSVHLLVQPAALGDVLTDEALANIGLWPRFLLVWPASLAPRVYRPWRAEDSPEIRAFWSRCDSLLALPVSADCDPMPAIELDAAARRGMAGFFERMEHEARRGELRDVRPFALRATEMACRVSGVLAAYAERSTIDAKAAEHGCELVAHSLDNWREALAGKADPVSGWAASLYRWLAERAEGAAVRDIPRIGPASVRPAARRDAAMERLRALRLIDDSGGRAVALGVSRAGR
jgi:hypothetical protein